MQESLPEAFQIHNGCNANAVATEGGEDDCPLIIEYAHRTGSECSVRLRLPTGPRGR